MYVCVHIFVVGGMARAEIRTYMLELLLELVSIYDEVIVAVVCSSLSLALSLSLSLCSSL